jgi:hypothetical protein
VRGRLTRIVIAAAFVLVPFGAASSASADTVTIGSALQNPDTPAICMNCVGVQLGQAGGNAPFPLTSPANGTVTSWAVRTNDPGALHTFRILRPSGANYIAVSSQTALAVAPGTTDATISYPSSLAIKQGDRIGLGVDPVHNLPQFTSNNSADVIGYSAGVPADGSQVSFTSLGGHELLVQATVKFCNVPILKKLKTKAAENALLGHDCTPKVKKSRVKKNRFRGRVVKQKTPAGTTAAPGTVVPIVIGIKK